MDYYLFLSGTVGDLKAVIGIFVCTGVAGVMNTLMIC
jgi:hypothetical protein